jgi:hypothetical protein
MDFDGRYSLRSGSESRGAPVRGGLRVKSNNQGETMGWHRCEPKRTTAEGREPPSKTGTKRRISTTSDDAGSAPRHAGEGGQQGGRQLMRRPSRQSRQSRQIRRRRRRRLEAITTLQSHCREHCRTGSASGACIVAVGITLIAPGQRQRPAPTVELLLQTPMSSVLKSLIIPE